MSDFSFICSATQFVSDILDSGCLLEDAAHSECAESLNYIAGGLDLVHGLLHLGVILSPDMETLFGAVFDSVDCWVEDHLDLLTEAGLLETN